MVVVANILKCRTCGIVGGEKHFPKNKLDKMLSDYCSGQCFECKSKYNKRYVEKNRDAIKNQRHQYQIDNREMLSKKKRLKYIKDREIILLQKKKYYKENRERVLERWYNYRTNKKNKIKLKARDLLKYAVQTGKIKRTQKCTNCLQNKTVEAHHENYNEPYNVVWLCLSCHSRLHAKQKVVQNDRARTSRANRKMSC